jgi:hypothetical protein
MGSGGNEIPGASVLNETLFLKTLVSLLILIYLSLGNNYIFLMLFYLIHKPKHVTYLSFFSIMLS